MNPESKNTYRINTAYLYCVATFIMYYWHCLIQYSLPWQHHYTQDYQSRIYNCLGSVSANCLRNCIDINRIDSTSSVLYILYVFSIFLMFYRLHSGLSRVLCFGIPVFVCQMFMSALQLACVPSVTTLKFVLEKNNDPSSTQNLQTFTKKLGKQIEI